MKKRVSAANQITEGVIWKQLLFFFFPIVLGTFFQQLYNTADTVIVGRFVGKEALASVGGSAGQIIHLVVGFFTGLASGSSVIVSQFFGAKEEQGLHQSLHTAYAFSLLGSAVIMLLGIALAPAMLKLMRTPSELLADSILYLRIYFISIPFVFIFNIGSSILRAVGDSKRPLYYLVVCCVLNIALDLLLILVIPLGVAGAAIATAISQGVSAILVSRALMKSADGLHLYLRRIRLYPSVLHSQLRIGVPAGLQTILYSISNIIIQASLNSFGTDTTAAWAAYGKLDAIFWMINGAFGIAITTFVGQNYGAGKQDRLKKGVRVCMGMDLLVSAGLTLFLLGARVFLFGIFTTDRTVVEIGTEMLQTIAPCYIFYVFIEILAGALRGVGDVVIPTILILVGVCLFRIVWVLVVMAVHPALSTIIYSYPATWITTAALFIGYYWYRQKH